LWRLVLRVLIESADVAETDELFTWLRHDEELDAQVSPGTSNKAHMGGLEVIDVILTHAVAIAGLGVSLASFLHSRRKPQSIVLTHPDGRKLTIDRPSETTADEIATFLADRPEPTGEQ
jgi:hypothetical protein